MEEEKIIKEPVEEKTIKESTVDGLINRLIELKYIKTKDEEISFTDSLKQATKQFENAKEISQFLLNLSGEIEKSHNEIFTSNGIDFSYLKKVLGDTVTKTSEINLQASENSQEEMLSKVLENQETLQKEKEAKIEEYKDEYINSFESNYNIKLEEDEARELAKAKVERSEFLANKAKLKEENPDLSDKELADMTCELMGVDAGHFDVTNNPSMTLVVLDEVAQSAKDEAQRTGRDENEIIIEKMKGNLEYAEALGSEILAKVESGEITAHEALLSGIRGAYEGLKTWIAERRIESISESEHEVRSNIYGGDQKVYDIKLAIEKNERKKRELRKKRKEVEKERPKTALDKEAEKRIKTILEKATEKYLVTDKSVSDIYEELKANNITSDLEFEDVLEFIIKNVRPDFEKKMDATTGNIADKNIITLIENERAIRALELTIDVSDELDTNGAKKFNSEILKERNAERIKRYKEEIEQKKAPIRDLKKQLVAERNLDVDKISAEAEKQDKLRLTKGNGTKSSYVSLKQVLAERNRISDDRKQIMELSKKEGIGISQATKLYFQSHPEKLEHYSLKEQIILSGDVSPEADNSTSKSTKQLSTYFKGIVIKSDQQLIKKLEKELLKTNKIIENGREESFGGVEFINAFKRAALLNESLTEAKRKAELHNTSSKDKSAEDVIKEKEKKAILQLSFKKYLETGKSIPEIYREMQQEGGNENIDISELYREVEKEALKLLSREQVSKLIEKEREINEKYLEIEAISIQLENAKRQDRTLMIDRNEKQIQARLEAIEQLKNENSKKKESMLRNSGVKMADFENQNASTENDYSAEHQKDVEAPRGDEKKDSISLEVEELSTESQGQIIDTEKVAQKFKIKVTDIKSISSWIKNLRAPKVNSTELNAEDKTAPTTQEVDGEEMSQ